MNKAQIGHRTPGWRPAVIIGAVAVVVAGALTGAVLLSHSGGSGNQAGTGSPPASSTSGSSPAPVTPTIGSPGFPYQPLWPFTGPADAAAWQRSYRAGGHQPWHLDAGQTALAFTEGYLGYTNVDKVINAVPTGAQEWVTVGFDNPNGQPVHSAVLHLARIGTGSDAPWEVVGTNDTTLSLLTPPYGTTVRSPVTVGGRISGVDESLRIQVRQIDRSTPDGLVTGIPAGGVDTPWTATVPFTATGGTVLTIAVSTGGHVAAVERFAIIGVRR